MAGVRLKPDEQQRESIRQIEEGGSGAALVASDTGTGKTLIGAELLRPNEVSLIIAPLPTHASWAERIELQHGGKIPVRFISSKDKNNLAFKQLKDGVPGAYIIGTEFFYISATEVPSKDGVEVCGTSRILKTWVRFTDIRDGKVAGKAWADETGNFKLRTTKVDDVAHLSCEGVLQGDVRSENYTTSGRKARWAWSTVRTVGVVILDECHAAKNSKSKMFAHLKRLRVSRLKVGMSATPGGDNFEGLWSICRWLWPDHIDRSKYRWQVEWMRWDYDPYTSTGKKFVGEKNPGEFVRTLPCYIRTEADRAPIEAWFRVLLEMTPAQKAQYDAMERSGVAWLRDNPLVADLPMVMKVRLRQMCLGEVALDESTGDIHFTNDCASSFVDAALKISKREAGKHILYLTNSNSFAHVVANRLNMYYGERVAAAWTGSESQGEREGIKRDFIDTDNPLRYIVGTITKAIAVGTDGLQTVCSTEVWMGKALESILNEQGEGRLNRRGQNNSITRYELIVPETAQEEEFALDARKFYARRLELDV